MNTKKNILLSTAIHYARLGYPVFPCVPGQKAPITEHGFKEASRDVRQIKQWWKQYPDANIGIPTSGLLVVDVDGADNPWPDDASSKKSLFKNPQSRTTRGGHHCFFKIPDGKIWRNSTSKLADHVDIRTDGGYIIAPPSSVNGACYTWIQELTGGPDALPEVPSWLAEMLDSIESSSSVPPEHAGNIILEGQRNSTLASLAGTMRRVGMTLLEIHTALIQTNTDRCNPPLNDAEVMGIANSVCRYEPDPIAVAVTENHYAQDRDQGDADENTMKDPGPIPDNLLRIPGFISEVMDYCLEIAPYPNQVMAFCGALAMQAFLGARKVRDPGDNRTNLYLLGLAQSSAGKDCPRKINIQIAHTIGFSSHLGDRFASGEGMQDALYAFPAMLFQTDEIDGMLQSIKNAKDSRHESIMNTLLSMYSAANTVFPMRRKAGAEEPGTIDQPCLVIFGTAIPNHYYQALSERMLTNGFFARMIIMESGPRGKGQEPCIRPLPDRILNTAHWWANFRPGSGNLEKWYPEPRIVEHTSDAQKILIQLREEAEEEYSVAEKKNDSVGTTVWGRVSEHTRKLALLYAISENPKNPKIGKSATQWASDFVMHQTRRMLFMAESYVAENPFHADCLKLVQKLREAPGRELSHSVLLKRMKMETQAFRKMILTLIEQEEIEHVEQKTMGRTGAIYRLKSEGETR